MRTVLPATILLALSACAPGIQGGWEATGHRQPADIFALGLSFTDDTKGLAVYATPESGERPVPVCRLQVQEERVRFVIDVDGSGDCSTLAHPLTFEGTLGAHVIVGTIRDATDQDVGMWRAYRRQPE